MVWAKFITCILIIFFSGRKIAKYGDIIADRTGLGGVWIGVILISLITSLPELFTLKRIKLSSVQSVEGVKDVIRIHNFSNRIILSAAKIALT